MNTDGGVGNFNQAFYISEVGTINPTFIAVQPTDAYQGRQDLDLYISGTGFQSGAQVSIISPDGVTITDVNVLNAIGIRLTVDVDQNATLGMRGALIVNPDGGHVLVTDKLEIKALVSPPEIVEDSSVVGPNPADPDDGPARIQFELTQDSVVTIRIMDIHGQILYEIVHNGQAGHNSVEWNWETFFGHGIPNGMYHCKQK
jgi:hypothetical protein